MAGQKVLFICSRNRWRSLTAEKIFDGVDGVQARSAGTEPGARIRVTAGHLSWADIIFVMEKKHARRLQEKFPEEIAEKKVVCLHIADDFQLMQPELVDLLEAGVTPHLNKTDGNAAPDEFLSRTKTLGIPETQWALVVNIGEQSLSVFEQGKLLKQLPCSTSRFGIGQIEGSNCTPLGLHRIAEKIGGGERAGTVFKSRKIVGHTSQPEFIDAKITTRIMWLEGLEPGHNRGGNVDSHARYIYIHGTADQTSIGKPASCGCIHLADADLIPLFDQLPSGTLVWIHE